MLLRMLCFEKSPKAVSPVASCLFGSRPIQPSDRLLPFDRSTDDSPFNRISDNYQFNCLTDYWPFNRPMDYNPYHINICTKI